MNLQETKAASGVLNIVYTVSQAIHDKKGKNLLALDVRGLSSLTDYLVIAEGNVERHVTAIGMAVIETMKAKQLGPLLYEEGINSGDWLVLDYGEVMVHIFMPGLREKYRLEHLWEDSRLVPLPIKDLDFEKQSGV
jgi:ribosome-associated protein